MTVNPFERDLTLHTTAPVEVLIDLLGDDSGEVMEGCNSDLVRDCFNGWGEPQRDGCKPHNLICDMAVYADAADIARCLIADGYEVVITDADEWSEVVTEAGCPMFYLGEHAH